MYTSLPLIILSLCAAIHGRPMPKGATRCKPDRSSTPTSIPVSTPASILVSTATSAYASASTSAPASIPASIPASVPSVSPPDVNGKQNNSASDLGFITRKGSQLFDGDEPFRFVSYNVPNLFLIEDKPGLKGTYLPPHPYEQQDAMATIAGSHGRVARSYTLAAGYGHHVPEIGTYNETAFLAMDHAIAAAKQHNVRLIIPLVNNHNGQDTPDSECNFGSYGSFTKLRRKKPSEFFTDETLRKDFKELLSFLLNRVNTVTGVAYKNEPIIMAWQLGNELGSWEKAVAPAVRFDFDRVCEPSLTDVVGLVFRDCWSHQVPRTKDTCHGWYYRWNSTNSKRTPRLSTDWYLHEPLLRRRPQIGCQGCQRNRIKGQGLHCRGVWVRWWLGLLQELFWNDFEDTGNRWVSHLEFAIPQHPRRILRA